MAILPKYSDTLQALGMVLLLAFVMFGIPTLTHGPQYTIDFWTEYVLGVIIVFGGTCLVAIFLGRPRK